MSSAAAAIRAFSLLGVELLAAGVEVNALLAEAQANGGEPTDETVARIEADYKAAVDAWNNA